jgi:hypothetical protein
MADILGSKVGHSSSRNKNAIVLVVKVGSFLVNVFRYELFRRRVELQQIVVDVQDKEDFPFGRLDGSRVKLHV